ncbi:hypothetical protein CCR80_01700 [Rhodothalassium salexigens]|nr:hypothetical protein [Rhodothalassium salexigens]
MRAGIISRPQRWREVSWRGRRPMRARSRSMKVALTAMAVATLVGLGAAGRLADGLSGQGHRDPGGVAAKVPARENVLPVATRTVAIQDGYTLSRTFTGRVAARRLTDLGFDRGGSVVSVLVDDGAVVAEGQVLARLDTDRLRAERRRLEAELTEARANLVLARKTNARIETLVAQGHTSEQRLDETQAQVAALKARTARLDAQLASVAVDLDKAQLKAPFDGTVQRRLVDEGRVVEAGAPVLQVLETGDLEARVGVPLRFARRLRDGAAFALINDQGRALPADLQSVAPAVRGATRTVTATFRIADATSPPAADGELVTLSLDDRVEATGFWTPLRALTADVRGLWRIYRLEPAGGDLYRIAFENVQLLYAQGDRAYVSGTVEDGVLTVAEGVAKVAPGQLVAPVDLADS